MFLSLGDIEIANYADDTTPYCYGKNNAEVMTKLLDSVKRLFKWFSANGMKVNADKCHLLSNLDMETNINLDDTVIGNSESQKLLGVIVDRKLTFESHVSNLCKTTSNKIHALARISSLMDLNKRKLLINAFIKAQFGYCPLVWMMHKRSLNSRINKLHERALRITYDDFTSTYTELMDKDNSVTIHHNNLRILVTEIFKIKRKLAPKIMSDVFQFSIPTYALRNTREFVSRNVRTTTYGTETISVLGPKLWAMLPDDIKNANNLTEFKRKIKAWYPESCPCRLCKPYIQSIDFLL